MFITEARVLRRSVADLEIMRIPVRVTAGNGDDFPGWVLRVRVGSSGSGQATCRPEDFSIHVAQETFLKRISIFVSFSFCPTRFVFWVHLWECSISRYCSGSCECSVCLTTNRFALGFTFN